MKHKYFAVLLISIFLFVNKVSAADMDLVYLYAGETSGSYQVYKKIGETASQFINIKVKGTDEQGFCLDYGATLSGNPGHENNTSIADYLSSNGVNSEAAEDLSKKINEYLHFGLGYNGQDDYKYHLATQKLIWDELYEEGYRQDQYNPSIIFYPRSFADQIIDISDEMGTIKNNISEYYKKPSFCNSNTIELKNGETKEFTDESNVLANYEVTCSSNINCEKNGNKLTITALNSDTSNTITISKSGTGSAATLYTKSGEQAVITGTGEVGPVNCTINLNTVSGKSEIHENPETGAFNMFIIWIIGFGSIVFALWTFRKTF